MTTKLSPGKIVAATEGHLLLQEEHLSRHVLIAGGSGGGKSKLTQLIGRQFDSQGAGFTVIDPHGDTVRATFRDLAAKGVDPNRVLYLEPSADACFSFDPFADAPVNARREQYLQWLSATCDRIVKALLRNVAAADQEVMVRLKRWLKNVLSACGVALDGQNTHVGIDKALIFTDPQRPEFLGLYARVEPHLPEEVRADFAKLIATKRPQDQESWLESTINRLRELLSPIVRLIFGQHAPSVDLRSAILERKIVLVNLAESDYLSREQGNILGGLLISFLLSTARRIPEPERVTHYLIIDEAENFVGEDLRMAFAELRKFKLVVIVIVQDLSCLRKGELELQSKVVSQCGLQMTFQQQNPDDVEYLGRGFGYGSLDLTPLLADVVLPDGYDWVPTRSLTLGVSDQRSESRSQSVTQTRSQTRQQHTAESIQEQVSRALSSGHTDGISGGETRSRSNGHSTGKNWSDSIGKSHQESWGTSESFTEQRSSGQSHAVTDQSSLSQGSSQSDTGGSSTGRDGKVLNHNTGSALARTDGSGKSHGETMTQNAGRSEGLSEGANWNTSRGRSLTQSDGGNESWSEEKGTAQTLGWNESDSVGRTDTIGNGSGRTSGESEGESHGTSSGETNGTGRSKGESASVSFQMTPLARQLHKTAPSGKLVVSVQDQLAKLMNMLASLPDRMVLVKCKGMGSPFLMRVHEVRDPYDGKVRSPAFCAAVVERLKRAIYGAHPCYFVPADAVRLAPAAGASGRPTTGGGENVYGH